MTMRLPTISQFKNQMHLMSTQYDKVAELRVQMATGKKLQSSSDDPVLASQIQSIEAYIERLNSYEVNTSFAKSRMTLSTTAMAEGSDLVLQAQDLLVQAQNDILADTDRSAIAVQLQGILDSMMAVANTQDASGEYIFNGFQAKVQAYIQIDDTFQYQGSYNGYSVAISEQTDIQYSESGYAVFGDIKSGNGSFSVASDTVNNTGTGVLNPVTITGAVVEDDYTLTMVTNGAGDLAYQVVGAVTGQVIPAPPLAIPTDAPEFVAGGTITFNGITTTLNGSPDLGDTFTINQSTPQSVFQTMQNIIDALNTSTTTTKSRADRNQILFEQASSLTGAFSHIVEQTSILGERAAILSIQTERNASAVIDQKIFLQTIADVDLAEVVSDLTLQLTALEMTQQSYTKIQALFSQLLQQQI